MAQRRLEAALLLSLLAAACGDEAERGRTRPNVLLISVDTLRADHLSAYGYARETSPVIDALARRGVLFEQAVSPTSWTLPAHLSMLTGLAISAHGVCDDRLWQVAGADGDGEVPLRGLFLPELLAGVGYATAGFYTWRYLDPRFGFGPGFDVYERIGESVYTHPEWKRRFEALLAAGAKDELRAWQAESPEIFDEQRPTAHEAVDAALAWLDARPQERPFFLFLHLFDVHDSYVPPPPYDTRFTDPAYAGPIDGRRVTTPDSPVRADMTAEDLEQLVALYDGEIAWVDAQIGRVIAALEERGLAEDTLVVVTSDHGEEFFEHGAKTHRAQLYRESVHVPLILTWPAELPQGERVAGTVGLVDVLPTVCALAGVPAPRGLSGRDLSAVARGGALAPADYVTELVVFPPGDAPPLLHVGLWLDERHALWHVAADGTRREVFDVAQNPRETGAGVPVPEGSEVARLLEQRLDGARERLRRERALAPERHADATPATAADVLELEKMGYTGTAEARGGTGSEGASRLCLDGCVWPVR